MVAREKDDTYAQPGTRRIVTICGPSGSGKTTLSRHLLRNGAQEVISTTTREPRAGEEHGKDYYFISPEDFEKLVQEGQFIEHATFGKNRYGLTKDAVFSILDKGKVAVAVLEINGVLSMRKAISGGGLGDTKLTSVFIDVPFEEAKQRLIARDGKDHKDIEWRISHLKEEAENIRYFKTPDSLVLRAPSLSELDDIAKDLLINRDILINQEPSLDISRYSNRIQKLYGKWVSQPETNDTTKDLTPLERDNVFLMAIDMDPTPEQKMVGWILDAWVKGDILVRNKNIKEVNKIIETYTKFKSKLPEKQRTILAYRGPSDMEQDVRPFYGVMNARQTKKALSQRAHLESWNFRLPGGNQVAVPITEMAARFFGHNTKWCTSAKNNNLFDVYSDTTLFVLQTPQDKYQIAMPLQAILSGEKDINLTIMDSQDKHLTAENIPYIRNNVREILDYIGGVNNIEIPNIHDILTSIKPVVERKRRNLPEPITSLKEMDNIEAMDGLTLLKHIKDTDDLRYMVDHIEATGDKEKAILAAYNIPEYWRDDFREIPTHEVLETMDKLIQIGMGQIGMGAINGNDEISKNMIQESRREIIFSHAMGLLDYDSFLELDPGISLENRLQTKRDIADFISWNQDVFCTSQNINNETWAMVEALSGYNPNHIRMESDVCSTLGNLPATASILEKAIQSNRVPVLSPAIMDAIEKEQKQEARHLIEKAVRDIMPDDMAKAFMSQSPLQDKLLQDKTVKHTGPGITGPGGP